MHRTLFKMFFIFFIFFIFSGLSAYIQKRKDLLKNLEEYTKDIKKHPKYEYLYIIRGGIYRDLKDYDKALKDYDRALRINKNYSRAYISKYHLYMELQKYKEALDAINKAIKLSKYSLQDILFRAQALDGLGRYKEALKDYETFLKSGYRGFLTTEPYITARTRAATIYVYLGENKKALDNINMIIGEMPKFKYLYYIRGKIYYAMKEYGKSMDDLDSFLDADEIKKSTKLNNEKNMARVFKAFIYAEKKDKDEVEENLIEVYKNGFNNDNILFSNKALLKIMGKDKILMLKDKYYKKP